MKLSRRKFLHLAVGVAGLPQVSRLAWAQAYPSRPVRLIVPFAPGGTTDIIARLIGPWLSGRLRQQFCRREPARGGKQHRTEAVVRATADGYTLLIATGANAVGATLYEKLNFNFINDIAPVAGLIRIPFVMEVNPSVPVKAVPEFIAYAKASPGRISMASAGIGSTGHMAGELFNMMVGVNMVHVPYRGSGPAVTNLLGGLHQPRPKRLTQLNNQSGVAGLALN